jgi:hypothetical protein
MKMSCQLQKNRLGPKNSIFTLILWRVKKKVRVAKICLGSSKKKYNGSQLPSFMCMPVGHVEEYENAHSTVSS